MKKILIKTLITSGLFLIGSTLTANTVSLIKSKNQQIIDQGKVDGLLLDSGYLTNKKNKSNKPMYGHKMDNNDIKKNKSFKKDIEKFEQIPTSLIL